MKKYNVGILGATGMVGQRFITLLAEHPWFNITILAASKSSAGKTYSEALNGRWAMSNNIPEKVKNMPVYDAVGDMKKIVDSVDFVFCAVNMKKDEIRALEEMYAKAECPVISNNSAHRTTPDVPMIIPEVNPEHMEIIFSQRKRLGTKKDSSRLNQTAVCNAMFLQFILCLILVLQMFLRVLTKLFLAQEKLLNAGRKWWIISFLTSAVKKKSLRANL